jgi:hypothetical protein
MRKILPPVEYLLACFSYNPSTGDMVWRHRPREHFVSKRSHTLWNARYSGTKVGYLVASGHLNTSINDSHFLLHRIIWKMMRAEEPPEIVDHKDRDPLNNKWHNLREATKAQNNVNALKKDRGVYFDPTRGKWEAAVKVNQQKIHLGRHDTKARALAARAAGVRKYFGEFAP